MNNRKEIARKSAVISLIDQISTYVLAFLTRKLLIGSLGVDYLGLNSTLAQILGTLSVTELGIQSVIIYKLYKPVVEDDRETICELMSLIRFFYQIVSCIIAVGGVVLIPFLKFLIKDISVPWNQIYLAWIMLAATSALSYILNYNSTIIFADQKQYIFQKVHLVLNVFITIISLVILYNFHNYFVFLLFNMVNTLSGNLVLLIIRKKLYPWIKYVKVRTGDKMFKELITGTMDVFAGRISGYVFNSTDNIVISAIISTNVVGFFGNYTTISIAVAHLLSAICSPIVAIVGNMLVNSKSGSLNIFIRKYLYIIYFVGSILIIPMALMIDDFVILFYGNECVIDKFVVILLVVDLFLTMIQIPTGVILDADGQFKVEKKFYIISAIMNIVLSVIGALVMGISGVVLATVIGRLYLWICRTYYCYKYVVKDTKKRLKDNIEYSLILTIVFFCSWILLGELFTFLSKVSIMVFILKGMISFFSIILIQTIIFRKTVEYKYFFKLIGNSRFFRKKNSEQ